MNEEEEVTRVTWACTKCSCKDYTQPDVGFACATLVNGKACGHSYQNHS